MKTKRDLKCLSLAPKRDRTARFASLLRFFPQFQHPPARETIPSLTHTFLLPPRARPSPGSTRTRCSRCGGGTEASRSSASPPPSSPPPLFSPTLPSPRASRPLRRAGSAMRYHPPLRSAAPYSCTHL
jgi:hypothetical protein